MAEIKAIETFYNGYRFRSRLEARWAVFFDAAGIEYEYEPEGYVLSDGTCYLPDFYLPMFHMFVEIKPTGIKLDYEYNAMTKLEELYNSDYFKEFKNGIVVALFIGDPANEETYCYCNFKNGKKRTDAKWYKFYFARGSEGKHKNSPYVFADNVITINVTGVDQDGLFSNNADNGDSCLLNDYEVTAYYDFSQAEGKARKARFEYGERG